MMPAGVQARGAGQPGHQGADIAGMEAVDIFARRDGQQNPLGIDLRRQRQLHQNAVDFGARVQRRRRSPAVLPW